MPAPRGKFIWYDVMTSDTKAATAFYSDVIGWNAQEHAMPDNRTYTVFSKGPAMVAGLMAIPQVLRAEGAKPCWSGYVATDDVDADATRVTAAGGAIRRPPEDIPNVGRFAVAADPGGAVFLLFKPNPSEEPKRCCADDAWSHRLARTLRRRSRSRVRLLFASLRLDERPRRRYGRNGHLPDLRDRWGA